MLHHRGDAGIAHHGRAEVAQPEAVRCRAARRAAATPRPQSSRAVASCDRDEPDRQGRNGLWPFGEDVEQSEPHAGEQDLGVDEARAQVEERAGAAAGDRPA